MKLGRLAIDFGNANTVVAMWDGESKLAKAVGLEPFSRAQVWQDESIPSIPSIIHYKQDGSFLIGNEVLQADLAAHEHTFIALKTTFDTVHSVTVNNKKITAKKAAEDFLVAVMTLAIEKFAVAPDEPIVLTVPVDTFEKYSKWLTDVASQLGIKNIRFIDEPSAAALSFGKTVKQNEDYLIFDFGAGSLDLALVRFKFDDTSQNACNCRVLGKKSMQLGGNNIDKWIADHFSSKLGKDRFNTLSLTNQCRTAKEKLSFADSVNFLADDNAGQLLKLEFDRELLVEILEEHEFFLKIDRTVQSAESLAQCDFAYKRKNLAQVFMVGGTSIIPELQRHLRRGFGKERVHVSSPLDSIATGAAAFAAGATLYDHVQHDYAIEVLNIEKKKRQMKVIIKRGEKFPSEHTIASEVVKAVTYGQTKFELYIYEISKEEVEQGSEFIDLAQVIEKEDEILRCVCLNRSHPTLLATPRPIMMNHPAMQIDFRIDENKHLVIDTYRFETDELKVPDMKDVIVVRLA